MNAHTFISAPDLTGTDVTAVLPEDFRLQSGQTLDQKDVIARVYGPKDAPMVVAAGGISAGRVLFAKEDSTETAPGWWEGVAGPGEALDLNRFRVMSIEFAPRLPAARVFTITTHDQARLVKLLLDQLGVARVYSFIGASYGAMIGLAFAEAYPDAVERLCIISAAHRAHPMATAFRGLQRRLLKFGAENGKPAEGISLARQLAMTTYRSDAEFDERFGGPAPEAAGDNYVVCQYLQRPRRRLQRHRRQPLDFDVRQPGPPPRRSGQNQGQVFLAAVPTDRLVPYSDMKFLHESLTDSAFIDFPSLYGHDAFLKESSSFRKLSEHRSPESQHDQRLSQRLRPRHQGHQYRHRQRSRPWRGHAADLSFDQLQLRGLRQEADLRLCPLGQSDTRGHSRGHSRTGRRHRSVMTASGLAALDLLWQDLPGDKRVIAPHDCYGGTQRLLNARARQGLISLVYVDQNDEVAIAAALSHPTALLLLETPSNPADASGRS